MHKTPAALGLRGGDLRQLPLVKVHAAQFGVDSAECHGTPAALVLVARDCVNSRNHVGVRALKLAAGPILHGRMPVGGGAAEFGGKKQLSIA